MPPFLSIRSLVLAGTVFAATALPAQAQFFGFWSARSFGHAPAYSPGVHPSELADIVADEGMRLVSRPYRNGRVFVADAVDRRGWQHRLIIDAYSGDIVQSFGAGQVHPPRFAQPAPRQSVARIIPVEPYVVPALRGEPDLARPAPKPRATRKTPEVARAPVETRELSPPALAPIIPEPPATAAPVKPPKKPASAARTPIETKPLEAPVKKVIPQVLPGYKPPAPFESESKKVEPPPVVAAPAKPPVNDVPVAPLYDAPAKPPAGKVNDIPVAPLD